MMLTEISLIAFSTLLLGLSTYWMFAKKKIKEVNSSPGSPAIRKPPSLPWIPFLGSIPFLPTFGEFHKFFAIKQDRRKEVVGFYLMNEYMVMLNTREAIRDAFVKRSLDFADRPKGIGVNQFLNPLNKGIFFHRYNEDFKKYHRLGLGIMKKFGFGSRIMESSILEEVKMLLRNMETFQGKEFMPDNLLLGYSMNVISGILFGHRFDEDDPRLSDIVTTIKTSFDDVGRFIVISKIPLVRYLPSFKRLVDKFTSTQNNLFSTLNQEIVACMESTTSRPSFVKSYIAEEGPGYDKDQLLFFLKDLFLAGSETTSSTLQYSLIFLVNYPKVQENMRIELDRVDLKEGMVSLDSRRDLPYCEAVLSEIFRMKQAAPLSVPHFVTKDTQILDYFIPSNTIVSANLYSVHNDASVWGDPENFRPERFLDGKGQLDESIRDQLVTFSLGKRSCFGEILAKQELFLSLTNIVKRFEVQPPLGKSSIEVMDIVDITRRPAPFEMRLTRR